MLTALGVGDAYGAAFDFAGSGHVKRFNDLQGYHWHPRHIGILPGQYTDDTQMSIAVAELVINEPVWTPRLIADYFVKCYQRDKRVGYTKDFQKILDLCPDGNSLLSRIHGDSKKSGAAMRAFACGFYTHESEVMRRAKAQAIVTHNTKEGIESAQAVALAVYYFTRNIGLKNDIRAYLLSWIPDAFWLKKQWSFNTAPTGIGTNIVNAAITVIESGNSIMQMLGKVVSLEGDTDTTAAITIGIASEILENIETKIPFRFIQELENGEYGCSYLMKLDKQLRERL